jgi:ubiquinone biosynthesis protein
MVRNGLVLAPESIAAIGRVRARQNRWRTVALWIIALAFLGILWTIR